MDGKWDQYLSSEDTGSKWDQYATPDQSPTTVEDKPTTSQALAAPQQKSPPTAEEIISGRPSILKDAVKNPIDFAQHPFKRSLQDIGAGFEVLEGVPASIGLDIQAGKPEAIIPNIGKVLKGERPAQRGDILRTLGIPEPIAATIGLLSGMGTGSGSSPVSKIASITKYLPDNVAANLVSKAGSTAYKVSGLKDLVKSYGKPAIARTLSVLSQVPANQVSDAIDNPDFLSRRFLDSERSAVQAQYKKVVDPLINDSSKKVKLGNLDVADLGFVSQSGEPTKVWESMSRTEQGKVSKWLKRLSSDSISFNQADSLKGQMDEALDSVYRKEAKGIPVDYSKDFVRTTRQLREKVNALVKDQYPEVGKVFDRYSKYKSGELLYKAFDIYHPHLWQTLIGGGIGVADKKAGALLIAGSVPKVQALGIQGVGLGREVARQSGAAAPEALFDQYRQNMLFNQGQR